MIWVILYILIAAIFTFALLVGAVKTDSYDGGFPWPVLCGIFWPLAGPIAAAFIAAIWFLNSEK